MAEILVIQGAPGSGKTTHSEGLAKLDDGGRKIFHVSAGNRLRSIRTGEISSRYSPQIYSPPPYEPKVLDHGLVARVVFEYVEQCPQNSLVLIDGFPKFVDAIGPFMYCVESGGHNLLGCVNLPLLLDTSLDRLFKRGSRGGEKPISEEFVRFRFDDYTRNTLPSILALGERVPILTVNAEATEEIVWKDFQRACFELIN